MEQIFYPHTNTNYPLAHVPLVWALLHIAPLWGLILTLWYGDMNGFIVVVPGVVAGLSVVAALLINRWWARFLVIIGMSIWFFWAFCILAMSA
jgi:hypothetical protein